MIKFLPDFTVALKSRKQEQENGIEARLLRFVRFERRNLFGLISLCLHAIKYKEERKKVQLSHACRIQITPQHLDRTEHTSYNNYRFHPRCNNEETIISSRYSLYSALRSGQGERLLLTIVVILFIFLREKNIEFFSKKT